MNTELSIILLAAGLSSRMEGANKMLLPILDKPVLCHTLENLLATPNRQIVLVVGNQAEEIQKIVQVYSSCIEVVLNPNFSNGMTTSIQQGIRSVSSDSKGIMIALGDMPCIQTEHYNLLFDAFFEQYSFDPKTILIPFCGEQRGNPVIFSRFYIPAILESRERNGCKDVVCNHQSHVFRFQTGTEAFIQDLDTSPDIQPMENLLLSFHKPK